MTSSLIQNVEIQSPITGAITNLTTEINPGKIHIFQLSILSLNTVFEIGIRPNDIIQQFSMRSWIATEIFTDFNSNVSLNLHLSIHSITKFLIIPNGLTFDSESFNSTVNTNTTDTYYLHIRNFENRKNIYHIQVILH